MWEHTRFIALSIPTRLSAFVLAIILASAAGCKKQADANTELANAVKLLEKSEAGQPPPPAPAPTEPGQAALSSQPVAQQMSQALTAYKGGNYDDAVSRLQLLRTRAVATPQQTMVVQDAMAAVMTDLYDRASKGDVKAKQAIQQYQENRNAR